MASTTEARPMRFCDVCGGYDDHPRHVHGTTPGESAPDPAAVQRAAVTRPAKGEAEQAAWDAAFAGLLDGSTVYRHMDCCRAVGCPDGSCAIVTAGAESLRGPALVKHLTSRKV